MKGRPILRAKSEMKENWFRIGRDSLVVCFCTWGSVGIYDEAVYIATESRIRLGFNFVRNAFWQFRHGLGNQDSDGVSSMGSFTTRHANLIAWPSFVGMELRIGSKNISEILRKCAFYISVVKTNLSCFEYIGKF